MKKLSNISKNFKQDNFPLICKKPYVSKLLMKLGYVVHEVNL